MSLIRNSSRKKFNINSDDLSSCLDQKNSMIAVLQAEVEDLRCNQERYDRTSQQVYRAKERYQSIIRQAQISKASNQERLQLSAKSVFELKVQVQHLDKQVFLKNQQLKDTKCQTQQLVEQNHRKQDSSAQVQIRGQQLRSASQMLKMEQERLKSQLILSREQLQKQRKENSNINKSVETVKDKCHKTQSYIRNLVRQQSSLNQNLAKTQDQNNYLDSHISELQTVLSIAQNQSSEVEKQIQQNKFTIASKELQLKRILKQMKEAARNLAIQKQKGKSLNQLHQTKKFNLGRLQNQVRDCSQELNYILSKNGQVTEVNSQMQKDLKVCQRHLQNVLRVNKSIQVELTKLKQINLCAIKKLQEPMNQKSLNVSYNGVSTMAGKWSIASRVTASGFQASV